MIVVNQDRNLLTYYFGNAPRKGIPVTCRIRDHRNPPDAHPEDSGGKQYPQFYQPQVFPAGNWHVLRIEPSEDPYTAPFFIATDAHQLVKCLDGSLVEDWGYGIHFSTSPTTWGCLRVTLEMDLRWLASMIAVGETVEVQ